ncbi:MAG TPA: hypothetical protein VMX37_01685, partial [Acidimicrobiia bacterium]|nr:hypothetical protein [Acidimicrobiia bacterium]
FKNQQQVRNREQVQNREQSGTTTTTQQQGTGDSASTATRPGPDEMVTGEATDSLSVGPGA